MSHIGLERYLEGLVKNNSAVLSASLKSWREGMEYEVTFWESWMQSQGLEWPEDFKSRLLPRPLSPSLSAHLPRSLDLNKVQILDVGAGPLTGMGTFLHGRNVELTAVDPLAIYYDALLSKYSIEPPCRTQLAFAEDLSTRFESGQFNLISCTNALDHSIEPMWGIIEMMMVLSVDGTIVLNHRRNEAEYEDYTGFHQWNFDQCDGKFVIWNRGSSLDVTELLGDVAHVSCRLENAWLSVGIRKLAEIPIDMLTYQRQLRGGTLAALLTSNST